MTSASLSICNGTASHPTTPLATRAHYRNATTSPSTTAMSVVAINRVRREKLRLHGIQDTRANAPDRRMSNQNGDPIDQYGTPRPTQLDSKYNLPPKTRPERRSVSCIFIRFVGSRAICLPIRTRRISYNNAASARSRADVKSPVGGNRSSDAIQPPITPHPQHDQQ